MREREREREGEGGREEGGRGRGRGRERERERAHAVNYEGGELPLRSRLEGRASWLLGSPELPL